MSDMDKKGYYFCGYYTNSFFEGKPVNYKTDFPKYKLIFYKIKYKLNGGRNSKYNFKKYNINTEFELSNPTRRLYRFMGWFDASVKKITKIDSGSTGNIFLEAKWIHESIFVGNENNIENKEDVFFKDVDSKKEYLIEMYQTELAFFDLFESKNNSLATADTILLTLASIFTSQFFVSENEKPPLILKLSGVILITLIMLSLGITLLNVIFKVGKRRKRILKIKYNHHSISGIIRYSQKEFINRINNISSEDIINDLAKQVYGLVNHNEKSQRKIRIAVIIDIIALIYFLIILIILLFIK